jgi:predicted nucleic acid-binding protein
MKMLIDTNIVLDVLLERLPWYTESSQIWQACEDGVCDGFLSATAVTDIFYIGRRLTTTATAQLAIGLCLATFRVASVDSGVLAYATSLPDNDFEDNVQIATAVANHLDALVTRNPSDFVAAPLPVLTPVQFLAQLP